MVERGYKSCIDDVLLEEALKISGLKTKNDAVNAELEEFIKRRKSAEILTMFGTVEYDEDYDYKKLRRREL